MGFPISSRRQVSGFLPRIVAAWAQAHSLSDFEIAIRNYLSCIESAKGSPNFYSKLKI